MWLNHIRFFFLSDDSTLCDSAAAVKTAKVSLPCTCCVTSSLGVGRSQPVQIMNTQIQQILPDQIDEIAFRTSLSQVLGCVTKGWKDTFRLCAVCKISCRDHIWCCLLISSVSVGSHITEERSSDVLHIGTFVAHGLLGHLETSRSELRRSHLLSAVTLPLARSFFGYRLVTYDLNSEANKIKEWAFIQRCYTC